MNRLAVVLALTWLASNSVLAQDPVPESQLSNELVGTWKMVSAKYSGRDSDMPNRLNILKHITPTHMTWMRVSPDSGEVVSMACGRWSIDGNQFSDTPEYGMGTAFQTVKGGTHKFTCKIVGDRWFHTGQLDSGLTIEEVWQRQRAEVDESAEQSTDR